MSKYYHMVGLIAERDIRDRGVSLDVDLTNALHRAPVHNDVDLSKLQQEGEYLWVSGGGTYLLNQRYLLTVQRPMDAQINPGKFSLFTGRADSSEELLHPGLLIRELFEELLLYSGKQLCKPVCEEYQEIIDRVYAKFPAALGLDFSETMLLPLRVIELATKTVTVSNEGNSWKSPLNFHVGPNRDVNILFLLAGQIDLPSLFAQDGEYHIESGKVMRHKRNIYLYDVETSLGQNISIPERRQDVVEIPLSAMSSHMRYLVESVAGWLASSASNN